MKKFYSVSDGFMMRIANKTGTTFSKHFYNFMGEKFTRLFVQETGISPSNQVGASPLDDHFKGPKYQIGEVSRLLNAILIYGVQFQIYFCWRSGSGKIVRISDEDFDEADLECWLEGLETEKYYAEIAQWRKHKLPFSTGKLHYDLDVRSFAYDMSLYITLSNETVPFSEIEESLAVAIAKHNRLADANALALDQGKVTGKHLQALHSFRFSPVEDLKWEMSLDAASPELLKKILRTLDGFENVRQVEME